MSLNMQLQMFMFFLSDGHQMDMNKCDIMSNCTDARML